VDDILSPHWKMKKCGNQSRPLSNCGELAVVAVVVLLGAAVVVFVVVVGKRLMMLNVHFRHRRKVC